MLRVYYSNRTEELLQAFVESLRTQRARTHATLFEPTHLVVPNRNIETYVKLGMARLTGIAANIQVSFLEAFINELAAQTAGDSQVMHRVLLHDLLLQALLDDMLLSHPELDPVRQYLKAAGKNPDAVNLRRFQLSRQLTKLFDEYAVSRPDLLASWKDGLVIHDDERKATEVWQRRLWLSIFGARGLLDQRAGSTSESPKTPFEAINKIDPKNLQLPGQVHFFGISYMARAFLDVLGRLAQAADLNIYMLNPCREVWEEGGATAQNVKIRRYERRAADLGPAEIYILQDPFRLETSQENPALRQWGRPGRENLRLLNALTGCELIPKHQDEDKDQTPGNSKTTLLQQIQKDIRDRQPERKAIPPATDFTNDESLVFLSCPGVRRELEAVASEIWSLLQKDEARADNQEPLRFNDIALILPPRNTEPYQSLVGTVFGEMHDIPHNLVDLPIGGESRLGEALELLLALPLGRFTRQEVLRFATHPLVIGRFAEASPDDWLGWCDSLGIVHGADRRDHRDTYIERDLLNWDQGLKRLALGAFMTGERSGDERIFSLGEDLYLPEEVPSGQMPSAASFGLLIRSLINDARFAARSRMQLPEWIQFITTLITTYVAPRSEEDERVVRRCLRRITALAEMTLGGRKVPYRIPYELVRSAMTGLQGGLGQYLVDGVVVSTFLPMRAVPFKVIFIVGLGEKQFPAADPKSRLDLRLANRRAGDVRPREQDKYMFLETLLCAREKLYLSYVSRDELTGDRLEPSSVLLELRQMLEKGYVPRKVLEGRIDQNRYPLRRFDDPKTIEASPAAANEHRLRALGRDFRASRGRRPASTPDLTELQKNLPEPVWEELRGDLGLCPTPPDSLPESQDGETLRVPLSAIRKFLECPLQGSASFLLRMREEEDEDVLSCEDETFGTEPLHRAVLLREVFLRAVATEKRAPSAAILSSGYEESVLRYELGGLTPTGLFQKTERENHLEVLAGWAEQFRDLTGNTQAKLSTLRLGPSWEHAKADEVLDPVVLTLKKPHLIRIEISGTTQPLLDEPRGFLRLLTRRSLKAEPHSEFLRVFLDQVLLAAAGRGVGSVHSAFIINAHRQAKAVLRECAFRSIKQEEARGYLITLVEEMLSRVHDYLLPCDAVFELEVSRKGEMDKTKLASVLEKKSENIESTASRWGPVAHPEDYLPPNPADAAEMIRRRFWLYFVKRVCPEADS